MPNPPKPVERKRALGNPGKRPLPDLASVVVLPAVSDDLPDPPRPLGPEGTRMWARVWHGGRSWISGSSDLDLVLLLCESMDERLSLRMRVLRGGDWRDRVALRSLDSQIGQMLGQLAFTPVERSRLGVAEVRYVSALDNILEQRGRRSSS